MPTMLFVDDPVRGNPLRPTADAIRALDGEEWLSTILIDNLLQTTLKGCVPDHALIGSSDCYSYFSTYNDKLDKHDCADTVQTMRGGLQAYAKSEFRCISAACHQGHFFVVDVTFDSRHPAIFKQVNVYDSLSITSRRRATAVLGRLQRFLSGFCFHGLDHNLLLLEKQDYVVQQAVFRNCPNQNNSHDCGLFALDVIWHLLEGKEIHSSVFTQDHIGALREALYRGLSSNAEWATLENVSSFFPAFLPPVRNEPSPEQDGKRERPSYPESVCLPFIRKRRSNSAEDELYPVAFAITVDGEDFQGWLWFLQHLKASAPNLIAEHFRRECSYRLFTFMSDRCKGLNTALGNVFPANHNCFCAVHIRRNVESNHGKKFASTVTALSQTTSLPEKRALLTQLQQKSPGAYKYVTDIDANRWMDSAWLEDEKLPPRYGFRNSNISESANNMVGDARTGNWLDAIDGILIKMSLRITKSQSKYEGKDGVVGSILGLATERWEKCVGCRVYASGNDGETYSVYQKLGGELEEESLLKVRPVDCVCDCGKWQAIGVPCVHGMAYFRHQMKLRLEDVLDQAVDEYYKYRTQRELYRRNFVPVWRHLLEPDMMTLPPDGAARRMPGRPKTVRLRKNSRYAHEPEKSPTICSRCHQPGHNVTPRVLIPIESSSTSNSIDMSLDGQASNPTMNGKENNSSNTDNAKENDATAEDTAAASSPQEGLPPILSDSTVNEEETANLNEGKPTVPTKKKKKKKLKSNRAKKWKDRLAKQTANNNNNNNTATTSDDDDDDDNNDDNETAKEAAVSDATAELAPTPDVAASVEETVSVEKQPPEYGSPHPTTTEKDPQEVACDDTDIPPPIQSTTIELVETAVITEELVVEPADPSTVEDIAADESKDEHQYVDADTPVEEASGSVVKEDPYEPPIQTSVVESEHSVTPEEMKFVEALVAAEHLESELMAQEQEAEQEAREISEAFQEQQELAILESSPEVTLKDPFEVLVEEEAALEIQDAENEAREILDVADQVQEYNEADIEEDIQKEQSEEDDKQPVEESAIEEETTDISSAAQSTTIEVVETAVITEELVVEPADPSIVEDIAAAESKDEHQSVDADTSVEEVSGSVVKEDPYEPPIQTSVVESEHIVTPEEMKFVEALVAAEHLESELMAQEQEAEQEAREISEAFQEQQELAILESSPEVTLKDPFEVLVEEEAALEIQDAENEAREILDVVDQVQEYNEAVKDEIEEDLQKEQSEEDVSVEDTFVIIEPEIVATEISYGKEGLDEETQQEKSSENLEDVSPSPPKFIVLVALSSFGNPTQRANQDRTMAMIQQAFGTNSEHVEVLDGSDPANKDLRNDLFVISGIRGKYPQFFVRKGDKTTYCGDYEWIEYANETATLSPQSLLGLEVNLEKEAKKELDLAANGDSHGPLPNASSPEVGVSSKIIVLVSKLSGNMQQRTNQDRAISMLKGRVSDDRLEEVDGSNPANKDRRNALFTISGIRAHYPQFFLQKSDSDITFLGDYDWIDSMNESGGLASFLGGSQVQKSSAEEISSPSTPIPEIVSEKKSSEAFKLPGPKLIVLMSKSSGILSQRTNQDRAFAMLKGKFQMDDMETVDGSDPANKDLRNQLFDTSGIRGNYPQFFLKSADGSATSFLGDFEWIENANETGSLSKATIFDRIVESSDYSQSASILEGTTGEKTKSVAFSPDTKSSKLTAAKIPAEEEVVRSDAVESPTPVADAFQQAAPSLPTKATSPSTVVAKAKKSTTPTRIATPPTLAPVTEINNKRLVLLMSSFGGGVKQKAQQFWARNILQSQKYGSKVVPEEVDKAIPFHKKVAAELQEISGVEDKFPQLFIQDVASGKYTYVGGIEVLEKHHTDGDLKSLFDDAQVPDKQDDARVPDQKEIAVTNPEKTSVTKNRGLDLTGKKSNDASKDVADEQDDEASSPSGDDCFLPLLHIAVAVLGVVVGIGAWMSTSRQHR
ncbi:MULE transposase domain containing protein [Nitzschia inconspicua]|uniref:MULE transposase domain containing protein n=1 Tax=Nitzschia inconspicua TaxID=303405 RepID=A0A9K3PSR7_9STRA|nr:MULE transposase domain containing protein [Nitzschia inconspicua]